MENVSFTSKIRLVTPAEFDKNITNLSREKFINFPWKLKQSVLADSACTTGVYDCSFFALTDGNQVLAIHACPTDPETKNFSKIEKFIKNKINVFDTNLKGFILGGKYHNFNSPRSIKLNENFENFLKKYQIPYSIFRGGNFENNVAYNSKRDELLISNEIITEGVKSIYKNPMDILQRVFDNIKISHLDELSQ